MQQASNIKDFKPDMMLPGIAVNTSPSDFAPIEDMRMVRLQGDRWESFGDVMSSSGAAN
jgi:branched-chain amino acid transport system substrate-binding protein